MHPHPEVAEKWRRARGMPGRPNRSGLRRCRCSYGEPMAIRRSTQMLLIGFAVFVIGAGAVFVPRAAPKGERHRGPPATTPPPPPQAGTVVTPSPATPAGPTTFTIP